NAIKAEKLPEIAEPLQFAEQADIAKHIGALPGSIGPVGLKIPVFVDRAAAILADFTCGANETGFHFINVNWERDVSTPPIMDLRNVEVGDLSPDGKGKLQLTRGIEVGHIFQLGERYTKLLNATVLNEEGKSQILKMGCYGIGVSRIVAAAIEQHHDNNGI